MTATPPSALVGTPAHAREASAVARSLGVDPARGLSPQEVAARLEATGPNRLRETPPRAAWLVFTDQLRSGLFLILLAAAVLAALAQVGVRNLTRTEPTTRIVFYFTWIATLVSGLPAALAWQTPTTPCAAPGLPIVP